MRFSNAELGGEGRSELDRYKEELYRKIEKFRASGAGVPGGYADGLYAAYTLVLSVLDED